MPKPIYILNGPNLNLLGEREPHIYGTTTLADIETASRARAASLGFAVEFRQTNHEGVLVEQLHEARKSACGVIINPAGYTFTSMSVLDALKMIDAPKIELHITNIHTREPIYHNSLMSRAVTAVMAGFGAYGYELAVDAMARMVTSK